MRILIKSGSLWMPRLLSHVGIELYSPLDIEANFTLSEATYLDYIIEQAF
jgi:hypothetical protein